MRSPAFVACSLAFSLAGLHAPSAFAVERFSLEVARKLVGVSSPRLSPDGRHVAFIVSRPDFERNQNDTELWIADAVTGESRPLTFERRKAGSPCRRVPRTRACRHPETSAANPSCDART